MPEAIEPLFNHSLIHLSRAKQKQQQQQPLFTLFRKKKNKTRKNKREVDLRKGLLESLGNTLKTQK